MDQRNETFVPHVLAVTAGTVVDFPNSDRIYHNVFSLSKAARFDLGRYAAGHSKSVRFDQPGIVRVFCEIHSHMNAFILVFGHPFFAMTDADGRYRIDNVPPGYLQRRSPGTKGVASESRSGHRAGRRRSPSSTSRSDEAFRFLAAQPHLSDERHAGGAVDRRGHLPGQRPRHPGGRERRCSARSWRPARSSTSCGRRAPRRSRDGARSSPMRPKLKAAVDTERSADGPGRRRATIRISCNSNLLLVTNRPGAGARHGRRAPQAARSSPASRRFAMRSTDRESFSLLAAARRHAPAGRRCRLLIGIEQPEILGTVSVGFLLDNALARAVEGDDRQRCRVRDGRAGSRGHAAARDVRDARRASADDGHLADHHAGRRGLPRCCRGRSRRGRQPAGGSRRRWR